MSNTEDHVRQANISQSFEQDKEDMMPMPKRPARQVMSPDGKFRIVCTNLHKNELPWIPYNYGKLGV